MRIVVADEISPDLPAGTSSRTRSSTRTASAAISAGCSRSYRGAKRLGIMSEGERPQGTGPVLVKS